MNTKASEVYLQIILVTKQLSKFTASIYASFQPNKWFLSS